MRLAKEHNFRSIAFPIIGAGSGGMAETRALTWIQDTLERIEFDGEVRIVRFCR
jgi:O-acetyl-ADP-ribose deacetylase (regulator of RNase III)